MNYAAVLVLLLISFFLFSAGYEFIGFVALAGCILAAVTPERREMPMPVAANSRGMPIYAQTTPGKIPQKIKIRMHKSTAKSHWEDFGLAIGSVLDSVGGTIWRLTTGGNEDTDDQPQLEAPRGR